ncbi:hypothetical protein BDZ97DRAFT_1880925 [Flammula alnicola]|nr:hypothetical protein BDZ97DRAFT_1880925 [Flammula alnicola]
MMASLIALLSFDHILRMILFESCHAHHADLFKLFWLAVGVHTSNWTWVRTITMLRRSIGASKNISKAQFKNAWGCAGPILF